MKRLFYVLAAIASLAATPATAQVNEMDAAVIANLQKHGSDITKPHEVDFFFYFPSEQTTDQAATQLTNQGFTFNRKQFDARSNSWNLSVIKSMVLEVNEMSALTTQLNMLARQHQGVYDGWGAPVVK